MTPIQHPPTPSADWMPPLAVARLKNCHRDTVLAAIKAGRLRAQRFPLAPRVFLVRREDAEAWVAPRRGKYERKHAARDRKAEDRESLPGLGRAGIQP